MLNRIKALVCRLAGCKKEQPPVAVQTPQKIHSHMSPSNDVVMLHGVARQIYFENGSRKLPHIFTGSGYVPLRLLVKK
jgi:hypothetical protein